VLVGGIGRDVYTGGAGADRFMFLNEYPWQHSLQHERITDFAAGEDKIDLTGVLFHFTFAGAFDGSGPQIVIDDTAGGARVLIDQDGDGAADVQIAIDMPGGGTLDSGDFLIS
jgi:Ca2+-binding RTX toxin-like protein